MWSRASGRSGIHPNFLMRRGITPPSVGGRTGNQRGERTRIIAAPIGRLGNWVIGLLPEQRPGETRRGATAFGADLAALVVDALAPGRFQTRARARVAG